MARAAWVLLFLCSSTDESSLPPRLVASFKSLFSLIIFLWKISAHHFFCRIFTGKNKHMTHKKRRMTHIIQMGDTTGKAILFLALACLCLPPAHSEKKEYLFLYDSAGNVIRRKIIPISYHAQNCPRQSTESVASVKVDEAWSEVEVSINKDITDGDMLLVYSSNGLLRASFPLSKEAFTLDLSHLHRGLYVFCFRIGGQNSEIKFSKSK